MASRGYKYNVYVTRWHRHNIDTNGLHISLLICNVPLIEMFNDLHVHVNVHMLTSS